MGIFDFLSGKKKPVQKEPEKEVQLPEEIENQTVAKDDGGSPAPGASLSWSIWPDKVDDVRVLLDEEIEKARSQGLRVLIYTYAAWSPGSVGFKKTGQHHEEFINMLQGRIHVVEVYFDTMNQLNEIGFDGYSIPQLYLLEEDGSYRNATITGAAWGADTPQNITNVVGSWLASKGIRMN